MARLTIEAVQHAINELQAQGKKITNQNVISLIGHGSFSTLTKLRKLHPGVFLIVHNTVGNTVHNTVDDLFVNNVWQRLEPHIDKHVQSVLKQQYSTDNTVVNTDLQTKLEKVQSDLVQQDNDNAKLQTLVDNLRLEKSGLSCDKNDLSEQLQAKNSILAKLVFLVTTGNFGRMTGNKELGELIDLTPAEIGNLKQKGKKL